MTEEKEYDSFACSCDEDGKKECAEIKTWAKEYLSNPKYPEYACTDADFAGRFFYHMYLAYGISPEFIADQWGAWIASNRGLKPKYFEYHKLDGEFSTYIQCDVPEDGMAYTLKAWVDHYGTD